LNECDEMADWTMVRRYSKTPAGDDSTHVSLYCIRQRIGSQFDHTVTDLVALPEIEDQAELHCSVLNMLYGNIDSIPGCRRVAPPTPRPTRQWSAFYTSQLNEVAGDHRATWHITKEMLHSDDRPPLTSRQDAAKLCNGFCRFFIDKLQKIADTVTAHLSTTPAYHRQPVHKVDHACLLDELAAITLDEVAKVIRSLSAKSSHANITSQVHC